MGSFAKFARSEQNLVFVVGFDPGETTGWCVMGVDKCALAGSGGLALSQRLCHVEYGQISCREQPDDGWRDTVGKHAGLMLWGENLGVTKMIDIVNLFPNCAIVIEDFIPDERFDKARHTLSPVRITSAFCYGMKQQGHLLSQIHIQNRSMAKTTCTDLRMKNWGLYDSHSGPHARDASRLAFYFLRVCQQSAQQRHLAFPHIFKAPQIPKEKKVREVKVGERIRSLG